MVKVKSGLRYFVILSGIFFLFINISPAKVAAAGLGALNACAIIQGGEVVQIGNTCDKGRAPCHDNNCDQ
jgi:hypothetical protein